MTQTNALTISGRISDAAALDAARSVLVYEGGMPVLIEPLSSGHRAALERRANALAGQLAPMRGEAQAARARAALAALFGSVATLAGRDAAAMVNSYMLALADLPAWAIERACVQAVRGGVPGLNPDFAPTAARLHEMARALIAEASAERLVIGDVLRARIEPPANPAMRERVGKLFAELSAELKKNMEDEGLQVAREAAAARSISRNHAEVLAARRSAGMPEFGEGNVPVSPYLVDLIVRQNDDFDRISMNSGAAGNLIG